MRLERETLADRLLAQLRQQVMTGRVAPGQAMPTEQQLCEAFGVGRSTVREAVHGLIAGGLAERRGHQLIVRDPRTLPGQDADLAELAARVTVDEVFEMRKLLENKAVEQATRRWDGDDVSRLRSALDAMRDVDPVGYHEADMTFHRTVVELARNAVLQQVYEASLTLFFKLPGFWRVFAPSTTRPGEAAPAASGPAIITGWKGHVPIVDAIEARDAATAVAVNTDLLDRVSSALKSRIAAVNGHA